MRKMRLFCWLLIILGLSITLSGCGIESIKNIIPNVDEATSTPRPTKTPKPTKTQGPGEMPSVSPTPTESLIQILIPDIEKKNSESKLKEKCERKIESASLEEDPFLNVEGNMCFGVYGESCALVWRKVEATFEAAEHYEFAIARDADDSNQIEDTWDGIQGSAWSTFASNPGEPDIVESIGEDIFMITFDNGVLYLDGREMNNKYKHLYDGEFTLPGFYSLEKITDFSNGKAWFYTSDYGGNMLLCDIEKIYDHDKLSGEDEPWYTTYFCVYFPHEERYDITVPNEDGVFYYNNKFWQAFPDVNMVLNLEAFDYGTVYSGNIAGKRYVPLFENEKCRMVTEKYGKTWLFLMDIKGNLLSDIVEIKSENDLEDYDLEANTPEIKVTPVAYEPTPTPSPSPTPEYNVFIVDQDTGEYPGFVWLIVNESHDFKFAGATGFSNEKYTTSWYSTDPRVATVNKSGVVTGLGGGDCYIELEIVDNLTGEPAFLVEPLLVIVDGSQVMATSTPTPTATSTPKPTKTPTPTFTPTPTPRVLTVAPLIDPETEKILSVDESDERVIDVSKYTRIYDSTSYRGQINEYIYTAPDTGDYFFGISDLYANVTVSLEVLDSKGYRAIYKIRESDKANAYKESISKSGGVRVTLEKGQKYTIKVTPKSSKYGTYTLTICAHKVKVDISGYDKIKDDTFFDQEYLSYVFKPKSTRSYTFTFEDGIGTNDIRFYDDKGYLLKKDEYFMRGDSITVQLDAGKEYKIYIYSSKKGIDLTLTVK